MSATTRPAVRHFGTHAFTPRVMRLLAHAQLGNTFSTSHTMRKHCPVVLLALAAHHDQDSRSAGTLPGYTAAELAPFVGLGVGTVSTALRDMHRSGFVHRYAGDRGTLRYVVNLQAFRTFGSETEGQR